LHQGRDCRGLGLKNERTCIGMWRDRKRKEHSGLYGVSRRWLFYGLEGLDSFNIGGFGRPHISIPYVRIGLTIAFYLSTLLSSVSLERSSKSRSKSLYRLFISFFICDT
jgi:hypothetical protein